MLIFFSSLAFQILKRRRQRLNIIFSGFFISVIISNILNMIYGAMSDHTVILILNFFANFFSCFSGIFILIVNMIILESTIIFPVKRQNRYILRYGILLFFGILILVLLGVLLKKPDKIGVEITDKGAPKFSPIFFIYIISIITFFAVIPIIRTSLKIYISFETRALKKKWLYYFIGTLGAFSILYLIFIGNLLDNETFKLIISIYGISVIIWVSLMYYGFGIKIKT